MAATEKISITLGREELRGARRLASQLGLSLSTVINDAVKRRLQAQARKQAGLEVVATFPAEDRATPEEMEALLALWSGRRGRARRPKVHAGRTRAARGRRHGP